MDKENLKTKSIRNEIEIDLKGKHNFLFILTTAFDFE